MREEAEEKQPVVLIRMFGALQVSAKVTLEGTSLPLQLKLPLPRHDIHFHGEGIATNNSPGQSSHDAHFILLIHRIDLVLFLPEKTLNVPVCNPDTFAPVLQDHAGSFSASVAQS